MRRLVVAIILFQQGAGVVDTAHVEQALRDLKQGKEIDQNVAFLQGAIEHAIDPGAVALQIGTSLMRDSRFAVAEVFLQVARARSPKDGNVALLLGKTHAALFEFEAGLEHLSAAEQLLPPGPHPIVHEYLAKVLSGLQRFDEAEVRAKRAIDEAKAWNGALAAGKQPLDLVDFELNLASVYHSAVRYDDALVVLDRLAPLVLESKDRGKAAVLRAQILDSRGDEAGALAAFEQAQAAAPDDLGGLYQFATFHIRRNQHTAARPLLERVTELDPGHEGAWFNLARVLLRLGEKAAGQAAMARYQQIHAAVIAADERLTALQRQLDQRPGDSPKGH